MNDNKDQSSNAVANWTTSGVSILNGMFGDYLRQRGNELAIDMRLIYRNRPLALDQESLRAAYPAAGSKICVLIHGLCCSEGTWLFPNEAPDAVQTTYGSLLEADLEYTPFYVRYNTGLPIAENGRHFAILLNDLLAVYPAALDELVLIGHSMGGLVIRGACEYGLTHGFAWVDKLTRAFYLGTPHEGADLEKLTHLAVATLKAVPNPITKVIGDVLNLRSRGVKDLRHGKPLHADEFDTTKDAQPPPMHKPNAWLPGAQHYLIAGILTEDPQHIIALLFGDALVRVPQMQGHARADGASTLLPPENIKVFAKMHHMALAHDPAVYQQLKHWCEPAPANATL